MIESSVKRVLQGLSVVTVVVFGAFAVFHISETLELRADSREWHQTNGAWYAARCEAQMPSDMVTRLICQEAWGRKTYYDSAPRMALIEAGNYVGLALTAPVFLLLWTLLLRLKPKP